MTDLPSHQVRSQAASDAHHKIDAAAIALSDHQASLHMEGIAVDATHTTTIVQISNLFAAIRDGFVPS